MSGKNKPLLLVVDDDQYAVSGIINKMRDLGCEIYFALTLDQAITFLEKYGDSIDIAVLDIMIPNGEFFTAFETKGGFHTGLALGRYISDHWPNISLVAFSVLAREDEVQKYFGKNNLGAVRKGEEDKLIKLVAKKLNISIPINFSAKDVMSKGCLVISGIAALIAIVGFFTGITTIYELIKPLF